jgi:heptaprenyl diphosphate synthase
VDLTQLGLTPLGDDLVRVEARLANVVGSDDRLLGDVSGHLLRAGGKRLRPALTLAASYAARGIAGAASADVVTGAGSVELVHLGSLYHDDVIDEAEMRRGVPSVNARWSNIVAILAGDFLLARASSLAASLGAEVAALLADTIGELCRGQVLELQHLFDATRTEEAYASAIEGKTASLMATSCRVGGMVAEVSEPTLDALTNFGCHLGMCFQIVDDVLDLTGESAKLGKRAGLDLLEGVYTLPVIYALRESAPLRAALGGPLDPDRLDETRGLVLDGDAVPNAFEVARTHARKATDALTGTDELDETVVAALGLLVDDLVDREF